MGDDIIIGDKSLGEAYISLMNRLGVSTSPSKTHVSDSLFEFAKRWFYQGKEISPFPFSAIRESGKKYYLLTALLVAEKAKGWVYKDGISTAVGDFYGRVLSRPRRFRAKMSENAFISEQVMYIT